MNKKADEDINSKKPILQQELMEVCCALKTRQEHEDFLRLCGVLDKQGINLFELLLDFDTLQERLDFIKTAAKNGDGGGNA